MDKINLVDVGARDGINQRWGPFHAHLNVTAFEADEAECRRLNKTPQPYPIRYLPVALGARDEMATLYLTASGSCSSTLRPNTALCDQFAFGPKMHVLRKIPIHLQRMDAIVDTQPDVIKIDTQGTELHVLQGAGALLDRTLAVELEVEFIPQYIDQPLFADVDDYMRAAGFQLRQMRLSKWRMKAKRYLSGHGGQVVHGDVLYVRPHISDTRVGQMILAAYHQDDMLAACGAYDLIQAPSLWRRAVSWTLAHKWSNRDLRRIVDSFRPVNSPHIHDPDLY